MRLLWVNQSPDIQKKIQKIEGFEGNRLSELTEIVGKDF